MKKLIFIFLILLSTLAQAQSQCGIMTINPATGKLDCIGSGGGSSTGNLLDSNNTWLGTNKFTLGLTTNTIGSISGALTIKPIAVSGTNIVGNNLILSSGQGTGNSNPSLVQIVGYRKGFTSGTGLQVTQNLAAFTNFQTNSNFAYFFLGGSLIPSSTNYTLLSDGSNTTLSAPASAGQIIFATNGSSLGYLDQTSFRIGTAQTPYTNYIISGPDFFPSGGMQLYTENDNNSNAIGTIGLADTTIALQLTSPGTSSVPTITINNLRGNKASIDLNINAGNTSDINLTDTTITLQLLNNISSGGPQISMINSTKPHGGQGNIIIDPGLPDSLGNGSILQLYGDTIRFGQNSYIAGNGSILAIGNASLSDERLIINGFALSSAANTISLRPTKQGLIAVQQNTASYNGSKWLGMSGFTLNSATSYTTSITDLGSIIQMNNTGARTVSLTSGGLSSMQTGIPITIKDGAGTAGTANIVLTPSSGNIDGASSYTINANYGWWTGYYDGTNYHTIGHN